MAGAEQRSSAGSASPGRGPSTPNTLISVVPCSLLFSNSSGAY